MMLRPHRCIGLLGSEQMGESDTNGKSTVQLRKTPESKHVDEFVSCLHVVLFYSSLVDDLGEENPKGRFCL